MRVILLGTGGPAPDPKWAGSSVLVGVEGAHLMFDCGPGSTVRAVAAGVPPTSIDYLFFTHHHFDHNLDYAHLVLTRWDQGAGLIRDLRVFGPSPTEQMTRFLFDPGGVFDADLIARTRSPLSTVLHKARGGAMPRERPYIIAQDIWAGEVYSTSAWSVRAAPALHSEHLRCLAFRVDAEKGSVVISGDTEPTRSVIDLARGADVLIHMCVVDPNATVGGITRPRQAGEVAAAARVKTLVLTHLGSALDEPGRAEQIAEAARAVFSGQVIIGRDNLEVGID